MTWTSYMWDDKKCTDYRMYSFEDRREYNHYMRWSTKASISFLKKHVFRRRRKGKKYGYFIEKFIRELDETNRPYSSKDVETKLRHSVVYWKRNGKKRIEWDRFFDSNSKHFFLPPEIMNVIHEYYY